jgi:hypothetical protein
MTETESASGFASKWQAEVVRLPPLIAPARQFVYPLQIPGEEDALARGALRVMVRPAEGGMFLAMFALGFSGGKLPSGIYACPRREELCAVAGGYAYVVDTGVPERFTFLPMRPVVEVVSLPEHGLLLFAGHHGLMAWGGEGLAWDTGGLCGGGVRGAGVVAGRMNGFGWDMFTDRELPFEVDLRTGKHTGGAFPKVTR